MDVVIALGLGVSLAASAGLRAFLPLFVLGLAVRLGWTCEFSLNPAFQWLTTNPALIAFGTATVLEILADKIPAVDHALDASLSVLRPGAGILSILAVLNTDHPVVGYTAAVVLGTAVTVPVQLLKASLRVGSSATTAGVLNPVLSFVEDGIALVASVVSVLLPLLALAFVVTALWLLLRLRNKRRARRDQPGDCNIRR